ncbi:MAG: CopD family protein [Lysobacteraceae bacterium]
MIYLWTKTFHLVFAIGWMACAFYLPRILVNLAECAGQPAVSERLGLMGRRLYRFGHVLFGLMLALGLVLAVVYRIFGGWLHAKLALVAVIFAFYLLTGRMLKRAMSGGGLPSAKALRWFNEVPVLLLIPLIYLALAKPF